MSKETDQLASDYTDASVELAMQTTQVGDGFYQLNDKIDFSEFYPNGVIEFVKTDDVKKIADSAGVDTDSLLPPTLMSDETIDRFTEIAKIDFLNLSSIDKTLLSSEIKELYAGIQIASVDEVTAFLDNFSKFATAAAEENVIIPSKFREIEVASTDTSLNSFLNRTGTRRTDIVGLNNLIYPYLSERFKVPGVLQGTVTDPVGDEGSLLINFSTITKEIGVSKLKKGDEILITNSAQNTPELKQLKTIMEYFSEDDGIIRINDALLFDLDSEFTVKIHQFRKGQILSPGETIKIPK